MGINNIRDLGVSTCRGGSRLVATPLVTLMTVPFFFFFSDCLLVFLCLFQIVPHVGERHRDMILKVCSYLKTIIGDKYKMTTRPRAASSSSRSGATSKFRSRPRPTLRSRFVRGRVHLLTCNEPAP